MKRRILILFHQNREILYHDTFTINILKQEWELSGFKVEAVYGTSYDVPADVAINHVNLTVTPDDYLDYLKKYPVAINGRVRDISKTSFSKQLLKLDDDHEGKVIIKTDANFGGNLELQLSGRKNRIINEIAKKLSWAKVISIESRHYLVLESIRSVPGGVWKNKNLIVEKFLPEQDNEGNYRLRAWSFLGDRSLHVLTTSNHPIVKGNRILTREILSDHVPDELILFRNQMGIDYGRFDYAIVDGKVVLYDVNRTPTTFPKAAVLYSHKLKEMAAGIHDFLS
jgi:hypothetical protein